MALHPSNAMLITCDIIEAGGTMNDHEIIYSMHFPAIFAYLPLLPFHQPDCQAIPYLEVAKM
jgi:hypothetical protein